MQAFAWLKLKTQSINLHFNVATAMESWPELERTLVIKPMLNCMGHRRLVVILHDSKEGGIISAGSA